MLASWVVPPVHPLPLQSQHMQAHSALTQPTSEQPYLSLSLRTEGPTEHVPPHRPPTVLAVCGQKAEGFLPAG